MLAALTIVGVVVDCKLGGTAMVLALVVILAVVFIVTDVDACVLVVNVILVALVVDIILLCLYVAVRGGETVVSLSVVDWVDAAEIRSMMVKSDLKGPAVWVFDCLRGDSVLH